MISEIPRYLLETVAFGGIVVLLLFILYTEGQLDNAIPMIGLYALAGYRLMPSLQAVFRGVTSMRYNLPAVDLLYNHMYSGRAIKVYDGDALSINEDITLNNITFSYPNSKVPVIKDQTLTIKANTTVGFVGPTGCGKTTIIDIILGLLEPQSGELRIDGKKIEGKDIFRWQNTLGYVQQNIYLSDDTVAQNIAFGEKKESIYTTEVKRAASVANIDNFIESELPYGYETVIGERGIRLSGGQRQRLGIARAVYKNPSVLILDEATSALDGFTEDAIMDAIKALSGQKTILMIAHRLTTLRECDQIFMLDKGKIVDKGTYEELFESNQSFRQLAQGKKN
ncbi:MAG: ATP-binding cassette domain-containing protein [Spirochaetia bacterium]|nr:ATP-binding cassette domain-containing protein [Spirochaetia bacterium]